MQDSSKLQFFLLDILVATIFSSMDFFWIISNKNCVDINYFSCINIYFTSILVQFGVDVR